LLAEVSWSDLEVGSMGAAEVLLLVLAASAPWAGALPGAEAAAAGGKPSLPVTCGSTIKLASLGSPGFRLHSHDVPYGSGSGQFSVTCFPDAHNPESYWTVQGAHTGGASSGCRGGEGFRDGDVVRLRHATSGRWLHSHLFDAPATRGNVEVSTLGDGDTGDNWVVSLDAGGGGKDGEWMQGQRVAFKHADTGRWMVTHSNRRFGHPIAGQTEVSGSVKKGPGDTPYWRAEEGVYLPDKQRRDDFDAGAHDEL